MCNLLLHISVIVNIAAVFVCLFAQGLPQNNLSQLCNLLTRKFYRSVNLKVTTVINCTLGLLIMVSYSGQRTLSIAEASAHRYRIVFNF